MSISLLLGLAASVLIPTNLVLKILLILKPAQSTNAGPIYPCSPTALRLLSFCGLLYWLKKQWLKPWTACCLNGAIALIMSRTSSIPLYQLVINCAVPNIVLVIAPSPLSSGPVTISFSSEASSPGSAVYAKSKAAPPVAWNIDCGWPTPVKPAAKIVPSFTRAACAVS